MKALQDEINLRLSELLKTLKDGSVKEAMTYSLLAGGKRLRPILFITLLKSYGIDYHKYMDIACSLEMIHTYSLIHDDLPGMDNDDLRRGRPTCHKQFDEATAILAGDALLNWSMSTILNVSMDSHLKVDILKCLYEASGVNGMIYGQQQDIFYENKKANQEQLEDIHHHKTGALITASLQIGSMIACHHNLHKWRQFGDYLGLAFQIQDDLLDVLGDTEVLGKQVGSDTENLKSTYVTLLGIEKSQMIVEDLFQKCQYHLKEMNMQDGDMQELLDRILKRVN